MASVEDFVKAPSEKLLDRCSREQLVKIAEHFKMDVGDKRAKENMKQILKTNLLDAGVLQPKVQAVEVQLDSGEAAPTSSVLTFAQRERLLMLQLELKRLELEELVLSLKSAGVGSQTPGGSSGPPLSFDVSTNLRLVPQFNEHDPDIFFSLFERVADTRGWSDAEKTLLLQCILTGKAQEAYCALSVVDSRVYDKVKAAVLKAYELVPEAYRQRFRSWEKSGRQTHMEFVRELSTHFHRWCSSLNVCTFDTLCE